MKTLPFVILAVSVALLLPATLPAADAKPGRAGRGERLKSLTEKLSLTEEQQTKVKEIYAKSGPELRELRAKGRESLSDDDKKKMRELMKSQMQEIGAVLTPEQKEKMKEMRKESGGAGAARGKGKGKGAK